MDVCVWDIEGCVERGEGGEGYFATGVSVCGVNFLVLGFVAGRHVPIKAVFQARCVIIVRVNAFEGGLVAC